jgi:hypothetical protein
MHGEYVLATIWLKPMCKSLEIYQGVFPTYA